MDSSPLPNQALLTVASSLIRINSKSNLIHQFYDAMKVLEITDYWELDVYKGISCALFFLQLINLIIEFLFLSQVS